MTTGDSKSGEGPYEVQIFRSGDWKTVEEYHDRSEALTAASSMASKDGQLGVRVVQVNFDAESGLFRTQTYFRHVPITLYKSAVKNPGTRPAAPRQGGGPARPRTGPGFGWIALRALALGIAAVGALLALYKYFGLLAP